MSEENYLGLTDEGRKAVVGIISSICHDFDLEQAAALNGLDDAVSVKLLLMFLLAEARLIEPLTDNDLDL